MPVLNCDSHGRGTGLGVHTWTHSLTAPEPKKRTALIDREAERAAVMTLRRRVC